MKLVGVSNKYLSEIRAVVQHQVKTNPLYSPCLDNTPFLLLYKESKVNPGLPSSLMQEIKFF